MTKALKSGQLALTRAECQYFSLHPLNGKISFPSFGKPVVQMNERAITYCFASGGYACISAPCTTVWSSAALKPRKKPRAASSEERRVGKEGVSTGRSRWPP